MALKIYNQSGILKATIEPADNSTHSWALMSDNVLNLSFTLYEYVKLGVNDYIEYDAQRFTLRDDYRPEKKSSIEYTYSVKFYGIESQLKDAINLLLVDGVNEGTYSLTDNARVHAQLVVDNINRIKGTKDWVLGEVVNSGNKTITYDNTSCFDSLTKIAEEFETEWWVEGTTINISRCEHGDQLELGYGKGLTNLTKQENDKAPFFTRLYPVGSSRNIDKSKYGYARLRLPGGAQYVEQNTQYGIVERAEAEAFSHIYPRRVGKVSSVRKEDVKDEEGKPFTIYYFKDTGLKFDPNDYLMSGVVMALKFESGELNGYDFEANYHTDKKEFEIITQFPNEEDQLPGGLMIPKKGDEYVLYNISMPQEYYPLAEKELEAAVKEYLQKFSIDTHLYKAPSDYIYFDENGIDLKLGRRVKLLSSEYFPEGSRDSRVTSITRKINRPSQMDIECSYAVASGRLNKIETNIVDIQTAFKEYLNQEHLQVLKSWDSSDPTEYNVLSAVRTIRTISNSLRKLAEESDRKYLRKDIEDKAAELITFLKGIEVVGEALIDRLTVENGAIFKETLSSEKFVSGFPAGNGWALLWKEFKNAAGEIERKASMELDEITVRGAMRVYELIISQLSGENGTRLTTDMMRVHSIDRASKKIYLDTERGVLYNPFRPGDVLMVQRFGGMPTAGSNYNITKAYEFVVTDAGIGSGGEERLDWVTFNSFVGDITLVEERDVLTRVDSLYDSDRKGLIKHTSVEPGSPYIDIIYGMKTDPDNAVNTRMGRLAGLVDYWWGQLKGFGFMSYNAYLRGDFQLRTGEDVRTRFEILEGMLRSAIQSVTYNFTEEDDYFTNAAFTRGMENWEHESDIELYSYEGALIDMGINFLSGKHTIAEVVEYDGRQMLRLKDGFIRQRNKFIRKPAEGSIMYLNFRYKCVTAGQLKVGFENTATGSDFALQEKLLNPNTEYKIFEVNGKWDGSGDFYLGFTGDIYIDLLGFSNKPLEDYKREVSTLFEQTDEHIKAVAREVNNLEGYVKEAGWITAADGHKLWATHETVDGLGNRLTTHEASFHVTAEAISGIVSRIDKVEDEFTFIDHYIKTAGWITTADGNKLWATIERVDLLGEKITTHEASFHVTAEAINGMVTRLNTIDNTINSAGWITTADGNKLWASKQLENGNKIISYINQTATTITINASKIKLEGVVTANQYFKINTDGSMTANKVTVKNGVFTDVIIQGSLRCAFRDGYFSLGSGGGITVGTIGLQNNNHVIIPGSGGSWVNVFAVPWTSDYNGFRAIILNDDYGGTDAKGVISANAATSSGKYFYENGRRLSSLDINPKTGVEMIGFGEGNNFKGWLILNRFSTTNQNQSTGFPFTVMYAGAVNSNGSMRRYTGFDGDTITCTKQSEGRYRVKFGKSWSDVNNYVVFLSGESSVGGRYASVIERTLTHFDVYTGDDSSPNDSAFNFLVVNTHFWK